MQMFYRMTGRRENRKTLLALVIAGYLGVWLGFGVLVHSADWILHQVVAEKVAIIDERPWIIAAPTLVLAGVYQFTPLKYHCLDKCRSPLAFISEHWHGQDASRESVQLGINHGVFCIGCCWSLMVVMFAVGLGNLGWMLLLGVIMALEKNASWGWRLSRPLGAGLIFAGLLTLLIPGPATCAC
jgi:predicted metal-binding membrane protein